MALQPNIIQGLNEFDVVAVGLEDAGFSIGVGGQVAETPPTIETLQTWQADGLYHLP